MDATVGAGREAGGAVPASRTSSRNLSIQWLRGAAAVMVLLYHASHYLESVRGDAGMSALFGGGFGLLGVAIFFAISGALMAETLRRMPPATFFLHRIVRIYPLFLIASAVLPPLLLGRFALDGRALSLAPLGPNGSYRLAVEWTLIFEIFYYVVLFLLAVLGGRRRIVPLATVWLAVTVLATALLPTSVTNTLLPTILTILANPANAAFAGGLLIPFLARRQVFAPALAAPLAASVLLAASLAAAGALPAARLLAAVAAVLVVGLAMADPRPAMADTMPGRAASALGDWSYGLYLSHPTILLLVYHHVPVAPFAAWTIAVAAAIAVAAPLGMLDVRLYRTLRRRVDAASEVAQRRFVWGYLAVYAALAVAFAVKEIVDPSAPWVSGRAG